MCDEPEMKLGGPGRIVQHATCYQTAEPIAFATSFIPLIVLLDSDKHGGGSFVIVRK